jgi:hypothetical protein
VAGPRMERLCVSIPTFDTAGQSVCESDRTRHSTHVDMGLEQAQLLQPGFLFCLGAQLFTGRGNMEVLVTAVVALVPVRP